MFSTYYYQITSTLPYITLWNIQQSCNLSIIQSFSTKSIHILNFATWLHLLAGHWILFYTVLPPPMERHACVEKAVNFRYHYYNLSCKTSTTAKKAKDARVVKFIDIIVSINILVISYNHIIQLSNSVFTTITAGATVYTTHTHKKINFLLFCKVPAFLFFIMPASSSGTNRD